MHDIFWFADLDITQPNTFGHQAEKLAKLTQAKFPIIPGFVITTTAYFSFLKENNLDHKIKQLLSTIAIDRPDSLMQGENHIRKLFDQAQLSDTFIDKLLNFYSTIGEGEVSVSIYETGMQGRKHSMVTAENADSLLEEVKKAWAKMFTQSVLWHRHHRKIPHLQTGAEIIVQTKIQGNKSGTIITVDPQSHEKEKIVILSHHPTGEDRYILSKKNLFIMDRELKYTTNTDKLTHDEILALGELAQELEQFLYFPQEISWIIIENYLYIVETNPVSTLPKPKPFVKSKLPIARGKGLTTKIGTGVVTIIQSPIQLQKTKSHDIIIVSDINHKQLRHLKKIRGIIIESSQTNPAVKILLQRYGIPAISNVPYAAKYLHNGRVITIHGEKGEIYQGGFL